jgi:hypothetical protein
MFIVPQTSLQVPDSADANVAAVGPPDLPALDRAVFPNPPTGCTIMTIYVDRVYGGWSWKGMLPKTCQHHGDTIRCVTFRSYGADGVACGANRTSAEAYAPVVEWLWDAHQDGNTVRLPMTAVV